MIRSFIGMGPRVLVTGITGFAGSHLADYILQNHPDVEIYGLKRWRSPMDNIKHIEHQLRLYDGDLCDLSSLLSVLDEIKPDSIFHAAAQSFVPYSYAVPAETLVVNVIGTCNLLEAIHILKINPSILIVSSPEVYGNTSQTMTEDCPLKPCSPYAASKVAEEMIGHSYHQAYGQHIVISRAFAHEGPRRGAVFAVSNFARQLAVLEKMSLETIAQTRTYRPTVFVGNLDSTRTYCDVRDTVRAYWLLLEKGQAGEVYNIAGNERMALRTVLEKLIQLSTVRPRIEVDPRRLRPVDVNQQIADDSKFRGLTGWEPEIPFNKTLADTLQYWRENA